MRFEYDESTNTVFLYLRERISPGEVKRGKFIDVDLQNSAVIASIDEAGQAVRVEFMGADLIFSGSMLDAIAAAAASEEATESND